MARYLVVANLTAESPVLRQKARRFMNEDPEAEFVVLVPAQPVPARLHWMAGFDSDPIRAAGRRGRRARLRLLETGARVVAVRVGTYDVAEAIEEELRYGGLRERQESETAAKSTSQVSRAISFARWKRAAVSSVVSSLHPVSEKPRVVPPHRAARLASSASMRK